MVTSADVNAPEGRRNTDMVENIWRKTIVNLLLVVGEELRDLGVLVKTHIIPKSIVLTQHASLSLMVTSGDVNSFESRRNSNMVEKTWRKLIAKLMLCAC